MKFSTEEIIKKTPKDVLIERFSKHQLEKIKIRIKRQQNKIKVNQTIDFLKSNHLVLLKDAYNLPYYLYRGVNRKFKVYVEDSGDVMIKIPSSKTDNRKLSRSLGYKYIDKVINVRSIDTLMRIIKNNDNSE